MQTEHSTLNWCRATSFRGVLMGLWFTLDPLRRMGNRPSLMRTVRLSFRARQKIYWSEAERGLAGTPGKTTQSGTPPRGMYTITVTGQ